MTTVAHPSRPAPAPSPDVGEAVARRRTARVLAAAVAAQPLLIAVNALFHPDVDPTGAGILAGAEEGPTGWYVVHVVAALGAVLGAPAALGLRRLVRTHRVLGDVAVATGLVAAVVLSLSFMAEASALRLLAAGDVADGARLALAEDYASTPEFYAVPLGVLASVVTGLLFAIALLRERAVPRWQPWVFLVGSLVSLFAAPGTPLGPLAFGAVAVASLGLARRVAAVGRGGRAAVEAS